MSHTFQTDIIEDSCETMLAIYTDYTNLEIIQINTGFSKGASFAGLILSLRLLTLLHYNIIFLLLLWNISIRGEEGILTIDNLIARS